MDSQQTSPDPTVNAPAIRIRDNAVCAGSILRRSNW